MKTDDSRDSEAVARIPKLVTIGNSFKLPLHKFLKDTKYMAILTRQEREKIQALSLAKECYSMKLELLTNATVVDDAIKFVSQTSNDELKSSLNNSSEDHKMSSKPDYNKDKDELQEKQEQEAREIAITTNAVF
jgi:hypothetical protein